MQDALYKRASVPLSALARGISPFLLQTSLSGSGRGDKDSSGILDPQLFWCQLSSPALEKARLFLCNRRKVPAQDGQAGYIAKPGCVPAAAHQAATTAVPGEALVQRGAGSVGTGLKYVY